jgi:general secretion pathway protein D
MFLVNFSLADTDNKQDVTFNFVDVDLATVTKFISEITGKNFIFDDRVKGKITIIAPTKLNIRDAYRLYTSILELKGYTVVHSGNLNVYKIIPAVDAKQKGIEILTDSQPVDESYMARIITLNDISSEQAFTLIQPMVSRNGHISEFGPGNMILVVDSGVNIQKILTIIEAVDKPGAKAQQDIVFLKYSSAGAVAKILNQGMVKGSGTAARAKAMKTTGSRAIADERLNAVILFGDKGVRESMKSLIAALDVPSPSAQGRINVYFLENADAGELAEVLEGIIHGARPKTRETNKTGTPVTPFEAAGGISITADEATNALIIVASPSDYQNLINVIKQLDRRRRQVYVEVMIVEATIDRLRELGTQWRVIATHNDEPVAIGGFRSVDPTDIQNLIFGLTGLTGGGLGNFLDIDVNTIDPVTGEITQTALTIPGFAALFNLDEFEGAVNVLSTPQILTSDNQEATIHVGENVPFVSARERDITTTNTVLTSIERTDVGIILKITPQITEGDFVKLILFQEISAVVPELDEDILINVGPTTTVRSTNTSVVVKDNQTVVISGLIQERAEDNSTKIPILGDIPVLGWLFKTERTKKKKTNLLVFITPHIMKNERDLEDITRGKSREFAQAEKQYVAGELLVRFKDDISEETAEQIISERGASIIKLLDMIGVYHIRLREGQSAEDAVEEFSSMPEVKYAEPNYRIKTHGDDE